MNDLLHEHRLNIHKLMNTKGTQLPAVTALPDATEWQPLV